MSKSYCHADAETWDQFFARLDRLKEMESKNAALLADIEQYVRIASELGAEVDALRKDAARYQWFRTHENWRDSGPYDHLYEEELDAAIDAAINKDRHDPRRSKDREPSAITQTKIKPGNWA